MRRREMNSPAARGMFGMRSSTVLIIAVLALTSLPLSAQQVHFSLLYMLTTHVDPTANMQKLSLNASKLMPPVFATTMTGPL
jgi:hypothetical protein